MSDTRIKFSGEVDYSKRSAAYGSYKYLRVVPIGQGQAPSIQTGSTVMTQFELPNNVMNLSKSKLVFDLTLPPIPILLSAGTTPFYSAQYQWLNANALSLIDRITLTSRAGTILADIPNCGIFGNLVSTICTKSSDLATKTSYGSNNILNSTQVNALLKPVGDLVKCNSTTNYQANANVYGSSSYVPYIEPLEYFVNGGSVAAANGVATSSLQGNIAYQINLDAFKHTLLELNKDIYFGDNLILTITWQQSTKYIIQSVSETNPNTLQAAVPLVGGGVTAAIAATTRVSQVAPVMNNLSLFVACETNADIVAGLIQKVNTEGFTLNVPFTYCQKLITPSSTSTAIQQRINRTYGSHLLRCYTAVYDQLEADITMFNHPDRNIIDYNSFMDGLRLQEYTIKVADSTHWLTNERNFQGSCIQALQQFKDHCVHIDNWTGDPSCMRDDTVAAGLELGSDRTYSIQYNNAAAAAVYRIYLYFITQKQLVISKGILNVV